MKLKNDEEFEDRALEIYRKAKDRIQEIHKSAVLREKEEKIRRAEIILGLTISEINFGYKLKRIYNIYYFFFFFQNNVA